MVLVFILTIWLLIGYWIFRLQRSNEGLRFQRSLAVEVENAEGPELPLGWCYKLPIKLFYFASWAFVVGIFLYLDNTSHFNLWFYKGLGFYVKNILGISDRISISPLSQFFYTFSLFLLFCLTSHLNDYFVLVVIRKFFPDYYELNLKKPKKGYIFNREISPAYLLLVLIILLSLFFYSPEFFVVVLLVACPYIFGLFILQCFLGSAEDPVLMLQAAFKEWLFLGVVVGAGLCLSPIYVLTDKAMFVSIFFRTKEINWSEVIDLELKVEQSSSGVSSSSGFDKDRYSVSANATSKPDLDIKLFSFESKDILNKIVDVFKSKGISIHCKVDPSLDAALGGVDLSKLTKSEKDQFEILSYVNKTCKE